MPKITKRLVDAAKPAEREYFLWDEALPGFGLRVRPSGWRGYVLQYKTRGRTRRISLGPHGPITPANARAKALTLVAEVKGGGDPAERREADRIGGTIADLCAAYMVDAEAGRIAYRGRVKKRSTIETDRGRIERHIKPLLGHMRVRDVTRADVQLFMERVAEGATAVDVKTRKRGRARVTGGQGTARRTVGLLGGIFSHAIRKGLRNDNPVRGVERTQDGKRERTLSPDEYRALGQALDEAMVDGENAVAIAAIRALALTGGRLGDMLKLRDEYVDAHVQALRLVDTKTGRSTRPIGRSALEVILSAKRVNGNPHVFPGRAPDGSYSGLPKALARVCKRAKLTGVSAHTLRHAFGSVAGEMNYSDATIGALLGHAHSTVTGRYVHIVDRVLIDAADRVSRLIDARMRGYSADLIVMAGGSRGG